VPNKVFDFIHTDAKVKTSIINLAILARKIKHNALRGSFALAHCPYELGQLNINGL
jgi:hypothetical protein